MEIKKNTTLGAYEIHANINVITALEIAAIYEAKVWREGTPAPDGRVIIMRSHGKPNLEHMIEAILDKEPRTA